MASRKDSKNIVLVSGGPQQLLALVALMQQLHKCYDVVGVVSYVSGHDRVIDFDKYVSEVFGFEYLGSIVDLKDEIIERGFGSLGNALGTVFRQNLNLKIQKWLEEINLWAKLDNAQIAMSYRDNLMADNLFLNVISPQQVYLVPDGFYLTINKNLPKRIASFLLGVDSFFKENRGRCYLPSYLGSQVGKYLDTSPLEDKYLSNVYGTLRSNLNFRLEDSLDCHLHNPVSLLIWQNFYPKFIKDKTLCLDLFVKIIKEETDKSSNHLIVKPHPRSDVKTIEELKEAIPLSKRDSVTILEDDALIVCPVEVLEGLYKIIRVSGVTSTGLLALGRRNDLEVVIYTSSLFPKKIRSESKRFTSMLQIEALEL